MQGGLRQTAFLQSLDAVHVSACNPRGAGLSSTGLPLPVPSEKQVAPAVGRFQLAERQRRSGSGELRSVLPLLVLALFSGLGWAGGRDRFRQLAGAVKVPRLCLERALVFRFVCDDRLRDGAVCFANE